MRPTSPRRFWVLHGLLFSLLAVPLGCQSGNPSLGRLAADMEAAEADAGRTAALDPGHTVLALDAYRGPGVLAGDTGPARFARTLWRAFRPSEAYGTVLWLEQSYRAAASEDFDAALDRIAGIWREGGFGGDDPRFSLVWLTSEQPVVGWSPRSGRVTMHTADGASVLHQFDQPSQSQRVLLPIHAPSASVRGPVALSLEELRPGGVLVTEAAARQVLPRAKAAGAVGVLSASLGAYNTDPSGQERHLHAIQYRRLAPDTDLPVAQISRASFLALSAARARGAVEVQLEADVQTYERPLRTLVALVRGARQPEQAVAIAAHLDEPGAGDNASGVAALVESALNLREAIDAGRLPQPARTLAFVVGDEFRQSEMFLAQGGFEVIAGISADMIGQSLERTGAIALLERGPDPGARLALPPDEHSSWGQSEVTDDLLFANGLAVIARCAMVDVGLLEAREAGRPWPSADHPWEGGSDHDVFLRAGIPAVLFWHFTDFTYHTSLDTAEMVDPEEMRRTAAAFLATALAVADAGPRDLARYVESLRLEIDLRVQAAQSAGEAELAREWQTWGQGARAWLRALCLGPAAEEGAPFLGR